MKVETSVVTFSALGDEKQNSSLLSILKHIYEAQSESSSEQADKSTHTQDDRNGRQKDTTYLGARMIISTLWQPYLSLIAHSVWHQT